MSAYVGIRRHTSGRAPLELSLLALLIQIRDANIDTAPEQVSLSTPLQHCSKTPKPQTAVFRATNTTKAPEQSQPALFQNFF
jgi:hypothetical protein